MTPNSPPESRIVAGVSIEDALQAFHESVNQPGTIFSRDHWLLPKFERLRQLLADPITEDQSAALLDVLCQRHRMADLIEWLESPPVPWARFFEWRRLRDMDRNVEWGREHGSRWTVDLWEQRTDRCPNCGAPRVPVIWGYPSEEGVAAAKRGEIVLAGCSVDLDGPQWHCLRCGLWWRQRRVSDPWW